MQFISDVYFENNGEIDLLTGAMAPERFNQILARDLQLADRNLTQLSIINAKMNIEMLLGDKFSKNKSQLNYEEVVSDLEAELVRIAFLLKNLFRQNLINQSFNKYESGRNLAQTMDFIAIATNSAQVRRLTNSIQIAIERGTPILDVLNNQVQALNKQINISLLKKSGKSEITLLIPVVFLILPVSISFAIWPSIYGLNQAGF